MENNNQLVSYLMQKKILHTASIIDAFNAIDRSDFVGISNVEEAYEDYALYIGYDATISQPSTVAFMLEKLGAAPGDSVLDVGAGSGWTTALLATIVGGQGKVWGVEIMPELVKFGQHNLNQYNLPQAAMVQATEELGLPEKAPFDRILVSAGASELPTELLKQLKVGGNLVMPIQTSIWTIKKNSDTETDINKYPGFVFVPLQQ